jgi:hypothetical protein
MLRIVKERKHPCYAGCGDEWPLTYGQVTLVTPIVHRTSVPPLRAASEIRIRRETPGEKLGSIPQISLWISQNHFVDAVTDGIDHTVEAFAYLLRGDDNCPLRLVSALEVIVNIMLQHRPFK